MQDTLLFDLDQETEHAMLAWVAISFHVNRFILLVPFFGGFDLTSTDFDIGLEKWVLSNGFACGSVKIFILKQNFKQEKEIHHISPRPKRKWCNLWRETEYLSTRI